MKQFVDCIITSGTFIANGEMKSVDGSYIECTKYEDGFVTMEGVDKPNNMMRKDSEGREREEGSEWKEMSVQHRFGKEGTKEVIGCITTSGVLILDEEVKSVDGCDIKCKKRANGSITMQVLEKYECKGEVWRKTQRVEGEYACDKGGVRTVLGCITGGKYIPVYSQAHIS